MCWSSVIRGDLDVRTADKDIKAYKLMVHLKEKKGALRFKSAIRGFTYSAGLSYGGVKLAPRFLASSWINCIDEGYHSYGEEAQIELHGNAILISAKKNKELGSCICLDHQRMDTVGPEEKAEAEFALVECTIPKGSTYYRNAYDEIVSDSIQIGTSYVNLSKSFCEICPISEFYKNRKKHTK